MQIKLSYRASIQQISTFYLKHCSLSAGKVILEWKRELENGHFSKTYLFWHLRGNNWLKNDAFYLNNKSHTHAQLSLFFSLVAQFKFKIGLASNNSNLSYTLEKNIFSYLIVLLDKCFSITRQTIGQEYSVTGNISQVGFLWVIFWKSSPREEIKHFLDNAGIQPRLAHPASSYTIHYAGASNN